MIKKRLLVALLIIILGSGLTYLIYNTFLESYFTSSGVQIHSTDWISNEISTDDVFLDVEGGPAFTCSQNSFASVRLYFKDENGKKSKMINCAENFFQCSYCRRNPLSLWKKKVKIVLSSSIMTEKSKQIKELSCSQVLKVPVVWNRISLKCVLL